MISIAGSLSPERIIAPAAYVFAFVSCIVAWARDPRAPRRRQLAAALAMLEVALLLDLVFNGRLRLHDLLENLAKARHLYARRDGPQRVALGVMETFLTAGVAFTLVSLRGRPGALLAACGAILSLFCWFVEVISLHSVDAFLYRTVDGIMVVRLVWAACSLMVGFGILWDTSALRDQAR